MMKLSKTVACKGCQNIIKLATITVRLIQAQSYGDIIRFHNCRITEKWSILVLIIPLFCELLKLLPILGEVRPFLTPLELITTETS